MMRIYLSGPISGKTYKDASSWREDVGARLRAAGFEVRDPLRGKSFLSSQKGALDSHDYVKTDPSLSDKALKKRDVLDVVASDIILVNFSDAETPSIGSIYELSIADFLNKLIVMVAPVGPHPHDPPFVRDASVSFTSLEDAVRY